MGICPLAERRFQFSQPSTLPTNGATDEFDQQKETRSAA